MNRTVRTEAQRLDWLADDDLLRIESRWHDRFYALRSSRRRYRARADDLFFAWERWTRANVATRDRGLRPLREGG